jgi:hypothetical protein
MKLDLNGYEPKLNSHKEISCFRRTCYFHLHCSMLKMAAKLSEPLVNINQTVGSDILINGKLQAQVRKQILQKKLLVQSFTSKSAGPRMPDLEKVEMRRLHLYC